MTTPHKDLQERDAEIEQLRAQLAGCGVAAMQNTESSKAARAKPGDYGWSESYGAVCRAVDREIDLRAKLAALEGQEPVAVVGSGYALYWQGSEPLSKLLERFDTVKVGSFLYAAAGAAPVPEDWRSAVAMAYGHLWHINNEPMAPIPLRSEESASYAARKLLRDLLTTEERGEAINSVRAMLSSAPKDAP